MSIIVINMNYKSIQKIRGLIIDELKQEFPIFLPEHYILVEHRLQTLLMAKLTDTDMEAEKSNWKKKK